MHSILQSCYISMLQIEKKNKIICAIIFLISSTSPVLNYQCKCLKWLAGRKHNRESCESLPGKPPCTIAVPARTSRALHSWQIQRCEQLKSSPDTAPALVFLLTTLGLFSLRFFSLLKGKPSVCFYYKMPSIISISSYPRAPGSIWQPGEGCRSRSLVSHVWPTEAAHAPAASASIPMTSLSPNTSHLRRVFISLLPAGTVVLNDPPHGKAAVNRHYLSKHPFHASSRD